MTSRREPSQPPRIPGYEPSRLLGMGGFADVFLYDQLMPRRAVAVKVLLASSLGDDVRERFRAEADLMARLSHHPSIVTIYHADVAPDGRPFLVMEYCSRPGLGQRYRGERMAVAEVLRIGVRLASAVETAHRAGVLHRDIKPANVLVTDFGWPALTDFGIAATTGLAAGAAIGMSIPWAPPEMLAAEPTGDVTADVYSLAATVYSLLARRSPFEVPGGSNTAADLISRIERGSLALTGRGDVPASLQAVLERAMDRSPVRRHPTALALARALQSVEAELALPLTPLDLPEPDPGAYDGPEPDDADATRLRPVRSVSPEQPVPGAPPAGATTPPPAWDLPAEEPAPDGVPRSWHDGAAAVAGGTVTDGDASPGRGRRLARAAAAVAVVGVLGTAAVLATRPGAGTAVPEPGATAAPTTPLLAVPTPTDLVAVPTVDGPVVFRWANPDPLPGDRYLWGPIGTGAGAGAEPELSVVEEPRVEVTPEPGEGVCIEVSLVRADRRFSAEPAVACTP